MNTEGYKPMNKDEIEELMRLKGWTQTKLASELELSQGAIQRWVCGVRSPQGPASILMRMWLNEARESHKSNGHAKRKKAVA